MLRIFGLKTDEVAEEWGEFNTGKVYFHPKCVHESPEEE